MLNCNALILAAVAVLGGCATQPPAVAPQQASAPTVAVAPAAGRAPALAANAAAPSQSDAARTLETQKYARSQGFKPVTRDGKALWCRSEAVLGSHFEKQVCQTEAGMADLYRNSLDSQQMMMRTPACGGDTCISR